MFMNNDTPRFSALLRLPAVLVLALFLAAGVGGCKSVAVDAQVTSTQDPGDVDRPDAAIRFMFYRHLPFARATIDGEDVGFFLIDTGSSLTVVDKAVADRLNLPQVGRGRVRGVGGVEEVTYSVIQNLKVDRLSVGPHRAATVDLSSFNRSIGWRIAGILGINTLRQHVFTIDYAKAAVIIHENGYLPPPGAAAMQMHPVSQLPAVVAKLGREDAADRVYLQLDTGSNAFLTLPYVYISKRLDLLAGKRNLQRQSFGVGGASKNIQSHIDHLSIFGQTYRSAPLGVEVDSPNGFYRDTPVGRVGNRLMHRYRITVDWANRVVWAELVDPD